MKLVKVSARNLKGLTFEIRLDQINFFVGANFRGKSARADAIRLVLVGFLPELGKRNADTFRVCSARELVVEGEFDNGFRIRRRWWLAGDSVKAEHEVPEEFIGESDVPVLTAMLDAETYFALSERERVRYVFENLGVKAAPEDSKLVASLRLVEGATEEAVVKFVGALVDARAAAREAGASEIGIEFDLGFARDAAKTAREFAVRMEKTAQGLAWLRASSAPTVDVAAIDARKAALAADVRGLYEAKASKIGAFEVARANGRRRQALAAEIARKAAVASAGADEARKIAERRAEFAAIKPVSLDVLEPLEVEVRDAGAAATAQHAEVGRIEAKIAENERERAGIDTKTSCPYCGAAGEGWKTLKIAEIDSALDGMRAKVGLLRANLSRVVDHLRRTAARVDELRDRRRKIEAAAERINAANERGAALTRAIDGLERDRAEFAAIPPDDPAAIAAVESIQSEINVKSSELAELERARRAADGRAHDLVRLAEAEANRDAARVDEAVAKRAVAHFEERSAAAVASAFDPLLARANEIFGHLLATPIAYNAGEIGTWREGTWVSHKTFSGVEKALTYAAVQAALAARSPLRMVILDELGRFDDATAMKLFEAVDDAVELQFDQFVGIDAGRMHIWRRGLCEDGFRIEEVE